MEQLAKLIDTNHLETWEDVRAFEEKQTEVLAQQEQIQRKSSRVATDLARLSVFKGNLREMDPILIKKTAVLTTTILFPP